MAAPGAFDFRAQLQDILKTFQIEGGVLRKAAGLGHAVFVGFGGDFRGEMRFFGQQRQDFIFVGGRYEPALRFDDSGEKACEWPAMLLGPLALGEEARGLVRPDGCCDGGKTDEPFTLGNDGTGRAGLCRLGRPGDLRRARMAARAEARRAALTAVG